jgi:hypothetical protein
MKEKLLKMTRYNRNKFMFVFAMILNVDVLLCLVIFF